MLASPLMEGFLKQFDNYKRGMVEMSGRIKTISTLSVFIFLLYSGYGYSEPLEETKNISSVNEAPLIQEMKIEGSKNKHSDLSSETQSNISTSVAEITSHASIKENNVVNKNQDEVSSSTNTNVQLNDKNNDSAELEKLKETQSKLLSKINDLTTEMYLSNPNFGKKNGPGYYYRFLNSSKTQKTPNGFHYRTEPLISKKQTGQKNNKKNQIKIGDFVTFSLIESLPDSTVISKTPTITVLNDDKLPEVVKAAFSVGRENEIVTIVSLAKKIYANGDLPSKVDPDSSIIYTFKIVDIHSANSNDMNVLKIYK